MLPNPKQGVEGPGNQLQIKVEGGVEACDLMLGVADCCLLGHHCWLELIMASLVTLEVGVGEDEQDKMVEGVLKEVDEEVELVGVVPAHVVSLEEVQH